MTTHTRKNHIDIPLAAVVSSQLAGLGYDADTKTLAITFNPKPGEKEGPTYHYFDVSETQYEEFAAIAERNRKGEVGASVGSFFYANVKPVYDFQRIEPDVGPVKTPPGAEERRAKYAEERAEAHAKASEQQAAA